MTRIASEKNHVMCMPRKFTKILYVDDFFKISAIKTCSTSAGSLEFTLNKTGQELLLPGKFLIMIWKNIFINIIFLIDIKSPDVRRYI